MSNALRVSGAIGGLQCRTVLVVPGRAVAEPGYIKAFTVADAGSAKHEYHALAQMAYFQFQDEELTCTTVDSPLIIDSDREPLSATDGMVLCRDLAGAVLALSFVGENRKKLLEAAYRYCTRWVRLDI